MKCEIFDSAKNGKVFRLLENVSFSYNGHKYIVPTGFESDGFSIPRLFWAFVSPIDNGTISTGVCHDYLYKYKIGTRQQADEWLQNDLVRRGFIKVIAWVIYLFIRWFAASRWGTE